ncbi:hypothetical protein CFSAN001690_00060 [Salmonella enterica subsp. enterica serovar Cerro str. CFSAN001690]|nr:hypothetical protein CFSAN001691_00060 [Salmonella enterica subsp. enterica serovar Cerro str. CFSAN001691]ETB83514.1 hypothetical protein CFSAN001680_05150 [Salmonella enterica subsp. enterica serovar Cerro str. CFSAN001680]ETB91462.1 hypothetical protein CFSAN001690_00060 [Salmonella enterica subsp. enterica serovar Cerro str. CFSAN001690]ETB94890.1 hypothetical protein CFSAN001674_08815 [Salmonella enterica subsp. enterica serovar Cerro str. CFSAN001674]ETC07759.1 hypothetical protein CFS
MTGRGFFHRSIPCKADSNKYRCPLALSAGSRSPV